MHPNTAPAAATGAAPTATAPTATDGPTFAALGITPDLVGILARGGITQPSPVQALTIPDALAGRDLCGKARTGSGKTLAFGLPLVERTARSAPRRPHALVLVPTRELASQVARAIAPLAAARKLRVLAVFGGASLFRQAEELRRGVDIVIATPGRLNDLLERGAVAMDDVAIAVLDEADQMADMGFLPQVERILDRIERPHQTLLFSATLDGDVDRLVKRYQQEPVFHEAPSLEDDEPAMKHRFIAVKEEERVAVTAAIAAGPERTLLFVRTQRGAERLVKQLDREGLAAGLLHGGLSQPRRERALHAFASGSVPVLVATNVAARGIHVDGVDIVVHHDPPEDAKTYLHRSGRTARAGASGVVVTLVSDDQLRDVNALRREAKVHEAVVAMSPADPRLADLAGWEPPLEAPQPERAAARSAVQPRSGGWQGPRNRSGGQGARWRGDSQRRDGARAPGGRGVHSWQTSERRAGG